MKNLTTILIVDDSLIFRKIVQKCLEGEDDIQVIGSVRNGVKAIAFIKQQRPDLITLDIEMPEMNGIQTLNAVQELNANNEALPPIGVIMLSAFTKKGADITIKALESGAFDFITKPEGNDQQKNYSTLRRQLLAKIRYFTSRRIASQNRQSIPLPKPKEVVPEKTEPNEPISLITQTRFKAILIGVSTGGPRALMTVIPDLCQRTNIPIMIVQHMPPKFTESLAESLNAKCRFQVVEAVDNQQVKHQHVYIAPGGKHMVVRKKGADAFIQVNDDSPVHGCRPSVDVLFHSAGPVFGKDAIAVILTGMGTDGTDGLSILKRRGVFVIAQDETSSVVWGMPGSAVRAGLVNDIQPLDKIPESIANVLKRV
ncbi:MAG: Chemotaxis response regulator protein-glutamate methylesterase [Candidatus Magnetoglobus multicellularis str. Araruama]|uniref:Protein-glutamate methylesterase/protein-glutamine glutaminase n=1 Tax=Candidatus Magnetoglobus multicellularis str. Araruama TaxID=890399 RepID=A0A1V1PE19_9BACT|nr:MAG: Chemotaxis response regulator protein-glutamate methylesterase [Candidatus Magnetoglobus multicellularis str. Araruama]